MTASGGSVTESPEWLYFVTITSSVPRYSRGPNPGIHVHDRVPEIARANASTLRTLALASDAGDNRATGQFGVLARPHGQSPSTRTNPDNPWNRKALLKLIDRRTLSVGGAFWYIPGWVLDAFLEPQKMSLPSWTTTYVELWGYRRGAPFAFGASDALRTPIRRGVPEGSRAEVLVVASPTLAPRIIRPGTVLDAYCVEHRKKGAVWQVTDEDTVARAQMYVGRVLSEIPDHVNRYPLPGEPVKDLFELNDDRAVFKMLQERAEDSRSAPGLVSFAETGDAASEPSFARLEATTGLSRSQGRELVVSEQVGGDADLRGKEASPE